jgi:hypothetical protein
LGKAWRKSEVDLGDDVGWWAVRSLARSRREVGGTFEGKRVCPLYTFSVNILMSIQGRPLE